jgi:hypothetical protein
MTCAAHVARDYTIANPKRRRQRARKAYPQHRTRVSSFEPGTNRPLRIPDAFARFYQRDATASVTTERRKLARQRGDDQQRRLPVVQSSVNA